MSPYKVEIFDRNIEYVYHSLIDASNFKYSEDAMNPEKNTLSVPTDFVPSELRPNDSSAPRGWYVILSNEENRFSGVISGFDVKEDEAVITISQLITIFDINAFIQTEEAGQYSIEEYIKVLILREFVNNSDSLHLFGLSGSTITCVSATMGSLEYQNTDDLYQGISLLDDLIYAAFEIYGINTEIEIDPQTKVLNVRIGISQTAELTIEADLPSVIEKTFNIRNSNKEVNRVDGYDISASPYARTTYYLHPSGIYDKTDSNRIYPVKNSVFTINGQDAAKKVVDAKYNNMIAVMDSLAAAERTLNANEISELSTAASQLYQLYYSLKGFPKPYTTENGILVPADYPNIYPKPADYYGYNPLITVKNFSMSISATGSHTNIASKVRLEFRKGAPQEHQDWQWDENSPVYLSVEQGIVTYKHVILTATVRMGNYDYKNMYFSDQGSIYYKYPLADGQINIIFTADMARQAVSAYKQTEAYQQEIASAYPTAAGNLLGLKAEAIFKKNKYSNLIEIKTLEKDALIEPSALKMGQVANIIHNGLMYQSVLSGRNYEDGTITLTFGTVRLELTNWLKGRY